MATQPMTKFVALNVATAHPCLYLKSPSEEQLDAVLVWMNAKGLDMVTCLEGEAIFTKTGKGKPAPAIAIEFTSADSSAAKQMAELYPAPKFLDGVKLTNHEVSEEQTEDMDGLADDDAYDRASQLEADHDKRTLKLASDLVAIGATGPLLINSPVNPDDVPF